MESQLATTSLVMALLAACLLSAVIREQGLESSFVTSACTTAVLLWVSIAFARDVALLWLGSIALVAFALSLAIVIFVGNKAFTGYAKNVVGVARSLFSVIGVTAFLDLFVLVGLGFIESVLPYYVALM